MEWQLAEAEATEAELRSVIALLLREGDAVFASRRWRLGSMLLRPLEWVLRGLGCSLPAAQDGAHWRDIVDAHIDAIARRRALLQQLTASGERDVAEELAQRWREAGAEASPRA